MNVTTSQKIAIIGPIHPPVGGVSTHISRFMSLFSGRYTFLPIDESSTPKNGIPNLKKGDFWGAAKHLLSANVLIVHTTSKLYLVWLIYAVFGALSRKKVIIYIHSFRQNTNTFLFAIFRKAICRIAHRVIVTNTALETLFQSKATELIPAYIPPPCPEKNIPNDYAGANAVFTAKIQGKKIVISNAWRIIMEHGVDIYGFNHFLTLAEYCCQNNPDYYFVFNIADPSSNKEYIDQCIDNHRSLLSVNTVITNYTGDFLPIYRNSDIYIRLTTTDGDSISIRDAQAMGCHVIASNVVDRPNFVTIFNDPSDISYLAKLLKSVCTLEKDKPANVDDQLRNRWIDILES